MESQILMNEWLYSFLDRVVLDSDGSEAPPCSAPSQPAALTHNFCLWAAFKLAYQMNFPKS